MKKKKEMPGLEQTILLALVLPIEIKSDTEELEAKKKKFEAKKWELLTIHTKAAYDWFLDHSWEWKDTFPTFETLLKELKEKLKGAGAI